MPIYLISETHYDRLGMPFRVGASQQVPRRRSGGDGLEAQLCLAGALEAHRLEPVEVGIAQLGRRCLLVLLSSADRHQRVLR